MYAPGFRPCLHTPLSYSGPVRSTLRTRFQQSILFSVGFLWAMSASAHVVNFSTARGRLIGDTFALTVQIPLAGALQFLASAPQRPPQSKDHFALLRSQLANVAPRLWQLRFGDGDVVPPMSVQVDLLPQDVISFRLAYIRFGAGMISLRAVNLASLPAGSREFVAIDGQDGSACVEKMLTARDDTLTFQVTEWGEIVTTGQSTGLAARQPSSAWSFVQLGIAHIWTGYDHLLFLFGLLIVCRRFRSVLAVISCFTVAHSLTLALATLGWVNVPSRITESAIAASIIFVALENIFRRGQEPPARWVVTFAFGLIHGLGFATALRNLGVGTGGQAIALPLFTFNLGVEIGQIAIASVVLPILWQLRKRDSFVRIAVPLLSAISAVVGMFWLGQRAFVG